MTSPPSPLPAGIAPHPVPSIQGTACAWTVGHGPLSNGGRIDGLESGAAFGSSDDAVFYLFKDTAFLNALTHWWSLFNL